MMFTARIAGVAILGALAARSSTSPGPSSPSSAESNGGGASTDPAESAGVDDGSGDGTGGGSSGSAPRPGDPSAAEPVVEGKWKSTKCLGLVPPEKTCEHLWDFQAKGTPGSGDLAETWSVLVDDAEAPEEEGCVYVYKTLHSYSVTTTGTPLIQLTRDSGTVEKKGCKDASHDFAQKASKPGNDHDYSYSFPSADVLHVVNVDAPSLTIDFQRQP